MITSKMIISKTLSSKGSRVFQSMAPARHFSNDKPKFGDFTQRVED